MIYTVFCQLSFLSNAIPDFSELPPWESLFLAGQILSFAYQKLPKSSHNYLNTIRIGRIRRRSTSDSCLHFQYPASCLALCVQEIILNESILP